MYDSKPYFYGTGRRKSSVARVRVYNGTGKITINDLAKEIIRLTGSKSEIVHLPERAGDIRHSTASPEKIRAAGFTPSWSFADALAETIGR